MNEKFSLEKIYITQPTKQGENKAFPIQNLKKRINNGMKSEQQKRSST
jgi:hypothetical protein